jgi:hypothetical protein
MIFARYIGTDKRFTTGKVYLAKPEVEDSSIANFDFIDVKDDSGEMVRVKEVGRSLGQPIFEHRWDFEFLEEVYAVVAKPLPDFRVGQVVVVEDVAESTEGNKTGLLFSIKGKGFRTSDGFVILDHTNVYPGVMILDLSDGVWEKIRTVDEFLWVTVDGGGPRRSPEYFQFAIDRDGDIMVEPKVECVDDVGVQGLTKGNFYYIVRETIFQETTDGLPQRMLEVVDDRGLKVECFAGRFRV